MHFQLGDATAFDDDEEVACLFTFPQLVDDLLGCIFLPSHFSPFLRSRLLTLHLDQFLGGRSIVPVMLPDWRQLPFRALVNA